VAKDILPVIRASRYADQLPDSGRGSRSDEIKDSVTFKNGATLKVMSGGGGDAKRSGYTARVVAMTEVDKMDRAGEASRETSKIGQLEARTDAFADDAITYMECTVSYEEGRIWQEYIHGTAEPHRLPLPALPRSRHPRARAPHRLGERRDGDGRPGERPVGCPTAGR
jgi:hypothetical protein